MSFCTRTLRIPSIVLITNNGPQSAATMTIANPVSPSQPRRRTPSDLQLAFDQPVVSLPFVHQIIVCPGFDQLSVSDDKDLIGIPDGLQFVSDDDCGAGTDDAHLSAQLSDQCASCLRPTYRPLLAFCKAFSTSASLTASKEEVASVSKETKFSMIIVSGHLTGHIPSRRRMLGFRKRARAMHSRCAKIKERIPSLARCPRLTDDVIRNRNMACRLTCRCPPESRVPLRPISVLNPSGKLFTKSRMLKMERRII